jgi:hypothetical protein
MRRRRYRDIGLRTCACGCGQQFMLSTFDRLKRYLNHAHATQGHDWHGINVKRAETIRLQKHAQAIAALIDDDRRITVAQLVKLCEAAYRRGYGSGHLAGTKVRAKQKEQAA